MRRPEGEFALIAKFFAPLATAAGAFGLKDDVAALRVPQGYELVLKTDPTIEGVHFLKGDPPKSVAQKALRRNLSDLAAKGATPIGYLMALALPKSLPRQWLREFCAGLREDQRKFELSLLGGDTARGPLAINLTMLGLVSKGRLTPRSGARVGDIVFVSGTVGDAGLGLELLRRKKHDPRGPIARHRLPEPRLALGRALVGVARSAIDVSDGLVADLGHIADVSGVRIVVDSTMIPLSRAYRSVRGANERAVVRAATAGDDYEIAFTCAPRDAGRAMASARKSRTKVSPIGTVEQGRGVVLLGNRGKPIKIPRDGYAHF